MKWNDLKQRLLKPGDHWFEQFFRYFIVGGLATIVHWTIFALLIYALDVPPVIATSIGFCFGLLVNYLMSVQVVFSKRTLKTLWLERIIFVTIALIGLVINGALVWAGIRKMGWRPEIAQVAATATTFMWNFLSKKLLLFR